jgi:hypothetical protein
LNIVSPSPSICSERTRRSDMAVHQPFPRGTFKVEPGTGKNEVSVTRQQPGRPSRSTSIPSGASPRVGARRAYGPDSDCAFIVLPRLRLLQSQSSSSSRVTASALGASCHHWSRQLHAPGHTVRLLSPAYAKPYGMPAVLSR